MAVQPRLGDQHADLPCGGARLARSCSALRSHRLSPPDLLREEGAKALPGLRDGFAIAGHQLPVEALAVIGPSGNQVQVKMRDRLERRRAVRLQEVESVRLERVPDR